MTDLSFKEELSEMRERLRKIEATARTVFAMQSEIIALLRNADPKDIHIDWMRLRDELLESDFE